MSCALARALRGSLANSWGKFALLVGIAAALVGGTFAIQTLAIQRLLHEDAASTGHRWADYLAHHVGDLEGIAQGQAPSAESMEFFERAKKVGSVFRYKIFSAKGRLRLVSDELSAVRADMQNLGEHNVAAARAIAAGHPLVAAKVGTPPARPAYFSEAYVPVVVDGKTIAIVEVYVDQSDKRAHFHAVLWYAAVGLGLLVALAFGIPAAAWHLSAREKHRAEAHIHYLAFHDLLTGLPNRNRLIECAAQSLSRAHARDKKLALHHVDIDNFKGVNDAHGHNSGDLLIRAVADRLKALVGAENVVARLDGDEFAVLQTDLDDRSEAEALARQVVEAMAKPFYLDGHELAVTACAGFAMAPEDGETPARLLRNADLAMYNSRVQGRNCTLGFSHEMEAALQARLGLERTIREATLNDGFELYFQPIVGAPDGELVGFEALLRLRDTDSKLISPADFIPVAEKLGLIGRIGSWVVREACREASTWPGALTVAVNLSPMQFAEGGVCETVAEALVGTGLDARRLELEITESLLLEDTDAVLAELSRLKALGSAIVMDDFGTGYSSLGYLWRFPFDQIKIDRSFMQGYDAAERHAGTVVESIVALARSLKLRVTVEGVETRQQLEFAHRVQCHNVQGFYCGRPMPAEQVGQYLEGRRTRQADAVDAA